MELLRDYQQEMLARLQRAWKRKRSVMVQMPTGTGKTHLMAEVIKDNVRTEKVKNEKSKGCGVLVVAHRMELLNQIRDTLERFGIDTETGNVKVESIQKLSSGLKKGTKISFEPSLIVIDEAHHALAKSYRMLWDRWPKAWFLGLTATPCRLSGEAFTDLFDTLLQSWSIQEFIDKGWLSDFEYVSASPDSVALKKVRSLQKRGTDGDYQTKEMATVMDVPESIEHLYRTYRQFADGRKGIVYAIDRQHASHIGDYYKEQGVSCAVIDCKTPADERQTLVNDYLAGNLSVLVSVDLFGEGFDAPEVEFIQLARPTLSLSKYLQQVGRGMRISEGKQQVLILDNVGLYQTFGLPTDERDWRRTFYGTAAGKGQTGLERCVVLDGDGEDRQLVNLEMVRIKKSGRRRAGLEIFLKDGKYGVMRNGKVTCPATFKRISRLEKDSKFFALGIYNTVYREYYTSRQEIRQVTTVINRQGEDMKVRLYGTVRQENELFRGNWRDGSSMVWDSVGECYYDGWPKFQMMGGVEIVLTHDFRNPNNIFYKLRQSTGLVAPTFQHWMQILYNKDIVVVGDYLVVKRDHNHAYHIHGFLGDSVIVQCEKNYGYQQIFRDGKVGEYYTKAPEGMRRLPDFGLLGLQKVKA